MTTMEIEALLENKTDSPRRYTLKELKARSSAIKARGETDHDIFVREADGLYVLDNDSRYDLDRAITKDELMIKIHAGIKKTVYLSAT